MAEDRADHRRQGLRDEAEQRRRGAGAVGIGQQRAGLRLRQGHTHADRVEADRRNHAGRAERRQANTSDHHQSASRHRGGAEPHRPAAAPAHHKTRRDRGAHQIAGRADRKRQAERQRGQAVDVLQDERGGGDPREQPAQAAGRDAEMDRQSPDRRGSGDRIARSTRSTPARARAGATSPAAGTTPSPTPTAPKPNSATKFERQPNAVSSTPPISGATSGASAMIDAMRASSRPTRVPSYMSRTTARASTLAPDPPSAWMKRAAISVSMEYDSAHASVATQINAERTRAAPAAGHGDPTAAREYLSDGKPDQVGRDRELHLRCRSAQQTANRRQRRQIHVNRQRPKPVSMASSSVRANEPGRSIAGG